VLCGRARAWRIPPIRFARTMQRHALHLRVFLAVAVSLSLLSPSSGLRFYMKDRERACFSVSARPGTLLAGDAVLENGLGSGARLALEVTAAAGHAHASTPLYEAHDAVIGKFSVHTPRGGGYGGGRHHRMVKNTVQRGGPEDGHHDSVDEDMYDDLYADADVEEQWGASSSDVTSDVGYRACLVLTVNPDPGDVSGAVVRRAVTFKLHPADRPEGGSGLGMATGKAVSEAHVRTVTTTLNIMLNEMHSMVRDLSALQQRERDLVAKNKAAARYLTQLVSVSLVVLVATSLFQYSHYRSFFKSKKLC
jgi:emp24/gp25L/p24 family/GOLD